MKIEQIRNPTLIIEFGGVRFLVDPMFAPQGANPGIEGTPNSHLRNPLVPLPRPVEQLIDVDAVIVTHTHPDHWDKFAAEALAKSLPLFAQNEDDAARIRSQGFEKVTVLGENTGFRDVKLTKTSGQHGSDKAIEKLRDFLGKVSGVVFRHPQEKVLYIAGDTIWNDHVKSALQAYSPDVVVLNCGDAQVTGLGSIIMNSEDVQTVANAAPQAKIVATHMEAVNHCMLSRVALRNFADEKGFADRIEVPQDGEVCAVR